MFYKVKDKLNFSINNEKQVLSKISNKKSRSNTLTEINVNK
jgi:hypothetical protein